MKDLKDERPTLNAQRGTSNGKTRTDIGINPVFKPFDVGSWMLEVGCSYFFFLSVLVGARCCEIK